MLLLGMIGDHIFRVPEGDLAIKSKGQFVTSNAALHENSVFLLQICPNVIDII